MNIIGRQDIIMRFEKILASKQAELVAVYGRRRVGKTYLIRAYFESYTVFDFTGTYKAATKIQLQNFFDEYETSNPNSKYKKPPKNWTEAFKYLREYLNVKQKNHKKMVVFFDEMPWCDLPKSNFLNALQYFWNQHGSKMKNLIFITCGSSASWIIKNLVREKGGLYNRVTHSIELKPFTLEETEQYIKSKNLKFTRYQIVQIYMTLGGIPFYLNMIPPGKSVSQIIDDLFFAKNAPLIKEFKPLYYSLFNNAEHHIKIVEALAAHPYGLNREQLEKCTGVPAGGSLSRAIENLFESGFIITVQQYGNKSKGSIYRMVDFFSHFYLKFVRVQTAKSHLTWQSLSNTNAVNTMMGYLFENVFYTHLPQLHKALGIEGVYTTVYYLSLAGKKPGDGSQIDLIIERKDGIIHLCEAKYTSKEFVLTKAYTAILRNRRALFENHTGTKKKVVTTLLTTFPTIKNEYFLEEIHTEVGVDKLFV